MYARQAGKENVPVHDRARRWLGWRRFARHVSPAHDAVADSVLDAVVGVDHEGNVIEWNAAAERLFGRPRGDAIGRELASLVVPERLRQRHRSAVARHAREGGSDLIDRRVETPMLRADGTEFPVEVTISRLMGREPPAFVGLVRDITERRRFRERLVHQALHDALTGLPNRGLLMDRLELSVRRLKRAGGVTAVVFIDLDRFKSVNDSLGHAAGDELLMTVARRFRTVLRPEDTLARVSGDEFCAVCEGLVDRAQAELIAARLANALVKPISVGGRPITITASVGVVTARGDGDTAEALLSAADAAMYRAKEHGGAGYTVFDERMRSRAGERLRIESELREALERRELTVFYQPQVDLRTGETVGLEALARWRHPRKGLLNPGAFIPVAEEAGMIVSLGEHVLERACADLRRLAAVHGGALRTMSVNLSPAQFEHPGITESVQRFLESARVAPPTLCLEITESTLMGSAASTSGVLAELQGLGVRMAVDDFGTGYSSLSYLRRLPVDQLKIDRSFIKGLGRRDDDRAIVSAIVNMGHALGLSVLAEGVETPAQARELRRLGCDIGQGFGFARPLPASELPEVFDGGYSRLETTPV